MSTVTSFAQNEDDALRNSLIFFGGTARNMGTAGALTAMGADFSNASQNPAGLARFTKSNVSFSQNLELPSVTASFYGNENNEFKASYNFSNISYVKAYTLQPEKFNNWYSVQLGIGMNRIKSFNEEFRYEGQADSSILHSFIRDATGTPQAYIYDDHPFTAGLAYDVFAIDPGGVDGEYTTAFQNGMATHERSINRKGGITEFNVFTLSGNYANKLLLGCSFNFLLNRYTETLVHSETYDDASNWLNSINYTGRLDIGGKGINVKIGGIYMPTDNIRIGLSAETPTYYWMNDYWTNNMSAQTDDGGKYVASGNVPTGSYQYNLKVPGRARMSLAYVLPKFGSIGAEVEYVDYGNSKFRSRSNSLSPYSFSAENTQIDNIYKPAVNAKIGLEARINKQLYLRSGFAYYTSSYNKSSGNSLSPNLFVTGGAGYNFGLIYLDMAYVLQSSKKTYYAYDPTLNGSRSELNFKNSQVLISVGARF